MQTTNTIPTDISGTSTITVENLSPPPSHTPIPDILLLPPKEFEDEDGSNLEKPIKQPRGLDSIHKPSKQDDKPSTKKVHINRISRRSTNKQPARRRKTFTSSMESPTTITTQEISATSYNSLKPIIQQLQKHILQFNKSNKSQNSWLISSIKVCEHSSSLDLELSRSSQT
jgi:hypothetical protein